MTTHVTRFICLSLLLLLFQPAYGDPALVIPVLENSRARIVFKPDSGALAEVTDQVKSGNLLVEGSTSELWAISLMDGKVLTPSLAAQTSYQMDGNRLELTWKGLNRAEAPDLEVFAQVQLATNEGVARWRIRVTGLGFLALREVHFPRLAHLRTLSGESLAVPVWMGEKTDRARELLNPEGGAPGRWEWEYPGTLSMQCLAFYGQGGLGVLLSTNDTGALRKQFAVYGDGNQGLGLEVVHLPTGTETGSGCFETTYNVETRLFHGDWFTAAEFYRAWGSQQEWVRESRRQRGVVPLWVTDTGLWVWNRGESPGVVGPALELQEKTGIPVSVFWHWWHGCPYDAGFPEYLPPREGAESFKRALVQAQSKGIHALVYMNQRLWGMHAKSWKEEGAERFAVKDTDGKVVPEVYNTFMKVPCASMCMGTGFWRNKYAGIATEAVRTLGVDGIYMDQACSSLACYDPTHGHPLGGGSWWMQGFKKMEEDIRKRCQSAKQVALAGEGCGEAWLPHLDVMLSLQVSMERYAAPGKWEPIPFFQAVYHDCAIQYGNYSSLTRPPYDDLWPAEYAPKVPLELLDRKFSTQFRLEQARAFVWGQQPSIANFMPEHLESRKEEMDYVLRIARLRLKTLKFLRDGILLHPPEIHCGRSGIPMSRLSIYAGQQDAVKEFTKEVPNVLASAWKALDGSVAVVLANITDSTQTVHLDLDRSAYPLPVAGTLFIISEENREVVGKISPGTMIMDVSLPPEDLRVYEFAGS